MGTKKETADLEREYRVRDNFCPYLKRLRHRAGLTQNQLCSLSGVSYGHIGHLERTKAAWGHPSEKLLRLFARILRSNPEEMLGMAGRVSQDIQDIIMEHPIEICAFLRKGKYLTGKQWEQLTEDMMDENEI